MTATQTGRKSCLSLRDSCKRNSNSYTHVFEVQLFNVIVDDVTGNRVIPEMNMVFYVLR